MNYINKNKPSIIIALLMSGAFLAGCTTTPTAVTTTDAINTPTIDNTNVVNDDATTEGVTDVDDNTNIDQISEVDTSDWLTYENEEYGFSFKYPGDWKVKVNNQNCWILTSAKTIADREQFYIDNPKANNGTDAVPGNEMSLCVKDEHVDVELIQWAEENTYRYVDEEYRGESTFNSLPAYLIVDLDFGKSSNYFLKVDSTVYGVYYAIVDDPRSEQIDLITRSITFN